MLNVGDKFTNSRGESCKVVEYINASRVKVIFTEGYTDFYRKDHLISGGFRDRSSYLLKGNSYESLNYGTFTVVEDISVKDKVIEFKDTGYRCTATVCNIINGTIKDKIKPSVCGIGFIGEGIYNTSNLSYQVWISMIKRCEKLNTDYSNQSYLAKSVRVHSTWHNFQNFAKWFEEYCNLWRIDYDPSKYHLDKDILSCKQNLEYSESSCCIIPRELNYLHSQLVNSAGYTERCGKYLTRMAGKEYGRFNTKEEAIKLYGTLKKGRLQYLLKLYKPYVSTRIVDQFYKILKDKYYV